MTAKPTSDPFRSSIGSCASASARSIVNPKPSTHALSKLVDRPPTITTIAAAGLSN
jgi:hypothetical protein